MGDIDQALARAYARRGSVGEPKTPAPHFVVDGPPTGSPVGSDLGSTLEWPSTVRALEREHGTRFEQLADALVLARVTSQVRSLFFTSCHRSEGRTTLVLTLARALARRPGRTVLVDADLSGPMLARSLGVRPRYGLDDVLDGTAALNDALLYAPDDHLTLLPLRAALGRPREVLVADPWATAMARLRRDFDHVLIDGSPLFAGLSAVALPRAVDAAILVHNRKLTGPRAVLKAREVLGAGGIPLLGLAETFV